LLELAGSGVEGFLALLDGGHPLFGLTVELGAFARLLRFGFGDGAFARFERGVDL